VLVPPPLSHLASSQAMSSVMAAQAEGLLRWRTRIRFMRRLVDRQVARTAALARSSHRAPVHVHDRRLCEVPGGCFGYLGQNGQIVANLVAFGESCEMVSIIYFSIFLTFVICLYNSFALFATSCAMPLLFSQCFNIVDC
jgi:hypothetical protein